jgi:hypothetical protein
VLKEKRGLTKLHGLGVDISDIDTSLVGEEDLVSVPHRVDANVVFGVLRMRKERLDDEVVEGTGGLLDLSSQTKRKRQGKEGRRRSASTSTIDKRTED